MKEKTGGIYSITHIESGKQYIGSTKDFAKRWTAHRAALNSDEGRHANPRLLRAWKKHGSDAFVFAVLEVVEESAGIEHLVAREQHYLDTLKPAYNIRLIAESNRGYKMTEEQRVRHKAKMQAVAYKQIKRETRPCIVCGKPVTRIPSKFHSFTVCSNECKKDAPLPENLESLHAASRGAVRTEDTRKKISEATKNNMARRIAAGWKPTPKSRETIERNAAMLRRDETRQCVYCGQEVTRKPAQFRAPVERTYCSRQCAAKVNNTTTSKPRSSRGRVETRSCVVCGTLVSRHVSRFEAPVEKTSCSRSCASILRNQNKVGHP